MATQREYHAYDKATGAYQGVVVATPTQFAEYAGDRFEARSGPPVPTAAEVRAQMIPLVKAEAERRILAIVPAWKQRNLLARATLLAEKGRDTWTDAELAEWTAGEAIWAQVVAIRTASDRIEAMIPIPDDFTADSHWAAPGEEDGGEA